MLLNESQDRLLLCEHVYVAAAMREPPIQTVSKGRRIWNGYEQVPWMADDTANLRQNQRRFSKMFKAMVEDNGIECVGRKRKPSGVATTDNPSEWSVTSQIKVAADHRAGALIGSKTPTGATEIQDTSGGLYLLENLMHSL